VRIIENNPLSRPVFPGVRNVSVKGTCRELPLPVHLAAFSVNGLALRWGYFFRLPGFGKLCTTLLSNALMPKPVFPGVRKELQVETRHELARKFPEPRLQKHVVLKKLCVLQ
jgi:hypothetical protein